MALAEHGVTKAERVAARVTPETKALLARAAAIQGRTVTDFMVQSTVEAAQRVIREHEYIDLSQRDRRAFIEAVLTPLPPGERLSQAVERHRHLLEGSCWDPARSLLSKY